MKIYSWRRTIFHNNKQGNWLNSQLINYLFNSIRVICKKPGWWVGSGSMFVGFSATLRPGNNINWQFSPICCQC